MAQPRPLLSLEVLEGRLLPSIALDADSWTPLGPAPITNLFSGRVMALAPDPTDANVIYLGSSSGGVWKSTDAGANWTPLTDDQPTLFTGSLAIDPSNHLTVYAGTGDWSTAPGLGVLKSIDGGSTWTLLAQSTFSGQSISDLSIDPTNTSGLYAAASNGVWKSTNGATSWTRVLNPGGGFFNVVMDSTNPQTLYASSSQTGGVWKTTNGGTNWTQTTAPHGGSAGPTFLAISRTNPRLLFATYWNDGTGRSNAYRSQDAGLTWTSMNLQAYGGMSNVIISPTDANLGYMGSSSPFLQTTDGGNSWHNIGSPHPDHHGIAFDANGSLLEGNDGGVYRLIDPNPVRGQWASLNGSTLSITQFVGIDLNAYDRNLAFGGSQDNSTEKYTGSLGWATQVLGGDGGYTRIDPVNPNTIYAETQGYNLQRSDDSGRTFRSKLSGINTSDPANFYIFYTLDPSNPARLVYGTNRVYESTNRGDNWHPISTPNTAGWTSTRTIQALTIDPNDPATIYAVAGGTIFVTHNDGANWAQVTSPGYSDTFQQVLVDPTNSSSLYVVRNASGGAHVFHSSNDGATWSNISSNLPAGAAHAIALDPRTGTLFVGNENGVWASVNGGGSWSRYKTGLPNVKTNGLVLEPRLNVLAVDTYGRGMWEIALSANPDLPTGWSDADIGSPGQPGDAYFDGSTWTVSGGGADIWGTSDHFHFASSGFVGDGTVTAQVTGLVNDDPSAKAGVMIRDGTAANAAYAYVFVTPSSGVRFEYRTAAGASSASAGQVDGSTPIWIQLTRSGDTFTGSYGTDGVNWTPIGQAQIPGLSDTARAGLAVTAHNNTLIGAATFTNVSVLPAGWTAGDVGGPGQPGGTVFDPDTGTWTVSGGGADIGDAFDQFQFVSQGFSGDGYLLAQITGVQDPDPGAKAGLLFRDSTDPGAPFAGVMVTPEQGVIFQWRDTPGGQAASVQIPDITPPVWVQLTRTGDDFSAFYSSDGINWFAIGDPQTVVMNPTALAGLAVTAHRNDAIDIATFTDVALVPGGGGMPRRGPGVPPSDGDGRHTADWRDSSGLIGQVEDPCFPPDTFPSKGGMRQSRSRPADAVLLGAARRLRPEEDPRDQHPELVLFGPGSPLAGRSHGLDRVRPRLTFFP
jgi:hypothetical protein